MQSQVDKISPVLVEVKVEIPWEKVSQDLEKAFANLQRKARVRGFRQGKVPRNVVQNLMGKSVREEVTQTLIREAIGAAIETHALPAVAIPNVQPGVIEDGQPLRFSAKVEIRPTIESVALTGLDVERPIYAVGDEDVMKDIERTREQHADLVVVEPARAAAKGDIVTVDLHVIVEGIPRPDLASPGAKLELGDGNLFEEIESVIIGSDVGAQKTASMTFPEDFGNEKLRGKAAVFDVTIKELQTKRLPNLDDEFAKDLEHASLDAMKQAIRTRLEAAATRRSDSLLRERVVDKLVDQNPIAVPPSMVEQQQRAMIQELFQFQQMMGTKPIFNEQMLKGLEGRAERKVRAGLLFGEIVRDQKLDVSQEEIDKKLQEQAERTGKHIAKVRAEHQGDAANDLKNQILEQKLLEYLLSKATIKDVPVDSTADATSQGL